MREEINTLTTKVNIPIFSNTGIPVIQPVVVLPTKPVGKFPNW